MDTFLLAKLNSEGQTQEIKLEHARTTIGRDSKNKIHLDQDYISSRHAIIYRKKSGQYVIEDHDSRNGTYVNDIQVRGDQRKPIKAGDVIKLGFLKLSVIEKNAQKSIEIVPLRDRKRVKGQNFSTA